MVKLRFVRKSAAVLAVFLTAGAAMAAKPMMYECSITEKHRKLDWISDTMAIVIGKDGKVSVVDNVTLQLTGGPVVARVLRNTAEKMKVRWVIKGALDSENLPVDFNYDAMLDKATNAIAVYAKPIGYPNRFIGKGTCKVRTDGTLPRILR